MFTMVYFAYGFPSSFRLSAENQDVILSHWNSEDSLSGPCIVVITRTDVQIWSSGQNRYLMGSCCICDSDDVGYIIAGCVTSVSDKNNIAVVTSKSEVVVVSYEECPAHDRLSWAADLEEFSLTECNVDILNRVDVVNTDEEEDGTRVIGMCGDEECFCVVYQSGDFVTFEWSGNVLSRQSPIEFVNLVSSKGNNAVTYVTYLENLSLFGFVF